MPIIEVTTKVSRQVWKSPDGQRKIYELQLEYEGQPVVAKTYSDQIATVGWQGKVDTYEKPGRSGLETFVKQPPKEGGWDGSQRQSSTSTASSKSNYSPKDEAAIKAMWAIDKAKDIVLAVGIEAKRPMDEVEANIEEWGQRLFAMVERVKASENAPAAPEPTVESVGVEQVDMAQLSDMLGEGIEKLNEEEENPWSKTAS